MISPVTKLATGIIDVTPSLVTVASDGSIFPIVFITLLQIKLHKINYSPCWIANPASLKKMHSIKSQQVMSIPNPN
jgi:hypothetical protein